jgi:membrane-associated phospholipid phosphatase
MERTTFYNKYFLSACMVWWTVGLLPMFLFDKCDLFLVINSHFSDIGDKTMPFVTSIGQAEVIIPVLLLFFISKRFRTRNYFITALSCNIIPFLVQQGLKSLFDMDRPLAYFGTISGRVHLLPDWPQLYHRSFPSGHTAGAFSFCCFLSFLLPEKYKWAGVLLFLPALAVGYSRVYLGAHFVGDVYFGSMAGTLSTLLVFGILRKFKLTPQ